MIIERYKVLPEDKKQDIFNLSCICNNYDGTDYSFVPEAEAELINMLPEETYLYYLAYDDIAYQKIRFSSSDKRHIHVPQSLLQEVSFTSCNRLIGFIGADVYGNEADLFIFLHPDYRNEENFYEIFDEAADGLYDIGIDTVNFSIQSCDKNRIQRLEFMENIEAERVRSECLYELEFSRFITDYKYINCLCEKTEKFKKYTIKCESSKIDSEGYNASGATAKETKKYILKSDSGEEVSSLKVFYDENTVCIFEVETEPSCRKQGFAAFLLNNVLDLLKKQEIYKKAVLHVAGDNEAAIRLYKHAGFVCTFENEIYSAELF